MTFPRVRFCRVVKGLIGAVSMRRSLRNCRPGGPRSVAWQGMTNPGGRKTHIKKRCPKKARCVGGRELTHSVTRGMFEVLE